MDSITCGHFINRDLIKTDAPVFIDAGVANGNSLDDMLQMYPKAKIYGFEPSRSNLRVLADKKYGENVKIFNMALDDGANREMTFFEFSNRPSWGNVTGMNLRNPDVAKIIKYNVGVFAAKELFPILKIDYIDYFKMDIEGSEYNVIESMTEQDLVRIGQFSIELHTMTDYNVPKLKDKLVKCGFELQMFKERSGTELYGFRK